MKRFTLLAYGTSSHAVIETRQRPQVTIWVKRMT
ncbi:unnamed protein product [Strongylus vulgaris]|uniref:Uncharacterized protein n=1 Tax=Strongylus vulgaris TaxID=40348 RepID=A0A3P7IJH6_STRVU|nr:unnamed protein product [Strongylus vulgaris]